MPWTPQQKMEALMRLPWTVRTDHDAEDGYVAKVDELPSVVATGDSEKELASDLWEALEAALYALLAHSDPIPLPPDCTLPWERGQEPVVVTPEVPVYLGGEAWESRPTASGSSQLLQAAQ